MAQSVASLVERRLVKLTDLGYGQALELAAPKTKVYGICIRQLFGGQLGQISLALGRTPIVTVRRQGDFLHFPTGVVDGLYLVWNPLRQPSPNIIGPPIYVDALVLHSPEIDFAMLDPDPWAGSVKYAYTMTEAAAGGQTPYAYACNAAQAAQETIARLTRILLSASAAGAVSIRSDFTNRGGATGSPRFMTPATQFDPAGRLVSTDFSGLLIGGGVNGPLGGAPNFGDFDIPAGIPVEINCDFELPQRDPAGGNDDATVIVNGPVGSTLKVTFYWDELRVA